MFILNLFLFSKKFDQNYTNFSFVFKVLEITSSNQLKSVFTVRGITRFPPEEEQKCNQQDTLTSSIILWRQYDHPRLNFLNCSTKEPFKYYIFFFYWIRTTNIVNQLFLKKLFLKLNFFFFRKNNFYSYIRKLVGMEKGTKLLIWNKN